MSIRVKTYYYLARLAEVPIIVLNITLSVHMIMLVLRVDRSIEIYKSIEFVSRIITWPFANTLTSILGEGTLQEIIIAASGVIYTIIYISVHELLKKYFLISVEEEEDE